METPRTYSSDVAFSPYQTAACKSNRPWRQCHPGHRCEALASLKRPALTVAPGTTDAAKAHIAAVAERLRLVNRQLKDVTHRIEVLVNKLAVSEYEPGQIAEQCDAAILRSLPGVGRIVLATLLAEAHRAVQARDYRALAPVTKRSGKSCRIEMRQACSIRLRTAVYHWAWVATKYDARSRTHYAALRGRGHSHGRALRCVADRLLAVACAMLESRTTYDPLKVSAVNVALKTARLLVGVPRKDGAVGRPSVPGGAVGGPA